MTNPIPESKLSKIRAILDRAERGSTPEERQLAAEKAAELMAKYAVTEAMLAAAGRPADDPVEQLTLMLEKQYRLPRLYLLSAIAAALNSTVIDMGDGAFVYGHRSDLQRVEWLYTHLLLQATTGVWSIRRPGSTPAQVRSYRTSWFYGFVTAVHDRMRAGQREAVSETPGAELVLADRSKAALAMRDREHPRVRKASSATVSNQRAYAQGQAAGGRADIGAGQVGTKRRQIAR